MKLDNLKNQNPEFLEVFEPSEGHFQRFQSKLSFIPKKRNIFSSALRIASILLFGIIAGFLISEYGFSNKTGKIGLSEISNEYAEIEFFYTKRINSQMNELSNFYDAELKEEITKNEFAELDSLYETLKEDLGQNSSNQEVIDAMIVYYQTKVDILQKIITQLNIINPKKSNYENYEI